MKLVVAFFLCMSLSVPAAQAAYPDPAPTPGGTATPAPSAAPSATPSQKPSTATKSVDSELAEVATMVYRKDFAGARAELMVINQQFPNNADVNNLLGYTSRKLKQYAASASYYKKALQIDPEHLDALEYQGELFITTKKISMAKANLVKLKKLCGVNCSQYKDLKKAIGSR